MPRSRGGGMRAAPRPRSPSPQPSRPMHTSPPPPAQHAAAPPPQQYGGGGGSMLGGLAGMVGQGMALGTGSALAHRAVDGILGSRHPEPAQAQQAATQVAQNPEEPCSRPAKTFADCMSDNNADLEACRYYWDSLQRCRESI